MSWRSILGLRLVTQEPDRAAAFYSAIGFEVGEVDAIETSDLALLGLLGGGTRRQMRRGGVSVDLDCYDRAGAPYPAAAKANARFFQHLALVIDDVATAWSAAIAAGAVSISDGGPVTLPPSSGGVTAVKCRDPDGHPLEFIAFPDGGDRTGIDHSAIVVTDAATSTAFYCARGLSVGARTLNNGSTQDRLDGLHDTVVDVVPLLPEHRAPHLELLGYRQPVSASSPLPAVNDVAATRIVWQADETALVRDPDGHLHELRAG